MKIDAFFQIIIIKIMSDKKRTSEDNLPSTMENQALKREKLRSEKYTHKIPKFHYMEHYPAIVKTFGPLDSDSTGTGIKQLTGTTRCTVLVYSLLLFSDLT